MPETLAVDQLPLTPAHWNQGHERACLALRESWRTGWIGLPRVYQHCLSSLRNFCGTQDALDTALTDFGRRVAQQMEERLQGPGCPPEPAYHNRLHTADVLVTLTTFLHILRAHEDPNGCHWGATLLAAAVGHDFAHPGGVNAERFEIESRSWTAIAPLASDVPAPWQAHVQTLILDTDTETVGLNHDRVGGRAFAWNLDWCRVLLNEADILVSATAEFGPELSVALASEWEVAGFEGHRTVATPLGRQRFLQAIRFSSPAALALDMPQRVQSQLQALAASV